jgi:hypothetical protein
MIKYNQYAKIFFFILKGDKFRDLWGEHAGWAQTIMFIDDLKGFKTESKPTEGKFYNLVSLCMLFNL